MAKKHRVKRQNYVNHLLKLEKERDTYMERRMRPKRSREDLNEEEVAAAAHDAAAVTVQKKRRVDKLEEAEPTPQVSTGQSADQVSTATTDKGTAETSTAKRKKAVTRRY